MWGCGMPGGAGDPCLPPALGTPMPISWEAVESFQAGCIRCFAGGMLSWVPRVGMQDPAFPSSWPNPLRFGSKAPTAAAGGTHKLHAPPPSLAPASAEPWNFPAGLNQGLGKPFLAPSPLACCSGFLPLPGRGDRGHLGESPLWGRVPAGGAAVWGAGCLPACPGCCLCMPSTRALAVKAF